MAKQNKDAYYAFQELFDIFEPVFWNNNKDREKTLEEAKCKIDEPETEVFPRQGWAELFKRLKKEQRVSYSQLKKEVDLVISDKQETLELQQFSLIFPINVCFAKRIKSKLGEDDLEIISYDDFRLKYRDIDNEIRKASLNQNSQALEVLKKQKNVCNEEFSYFKITTSARQYSFAVSSATEKMYSVLALLIFAERKKQTPQQDQLMPIKISTLEQSLVFVFKENSYLNTAYRRGETVSERDFQARAFPFFSPVSSETVEAKTFDSFGQILSLYNKISRSEIGETLDKALRSYYKASIANSTDLSVFYYWIAIERLLKVRKMDYEEIKRILKKLMVGDEHFELIVDTLVHIRHGFAHEGIMEVESPTRNFAKTLCDSLMDWFLLKFDTQVSSKDELSKIYTFIQDDNESLLTDKKLIEMILSIRSNNPDLFPPS